MNEELQRVVSQVARVRNVDVSYVYDTLKNSIIAGLHRRFGKETEGDVEIDKNTGTVKVYIFKKVVKEIRNPIHEIKKEEAEKITKGVKEGDKVRINIPLSQIGRITIRHALNELIVKLREAEKTKLFNEYIKKKKEIITGSIHKIDKEEIIVNLGPVHGILPLKDQMKNDRYYIGAIFKFYVVRVEKTPIGPRIYLSRTHPEFLRKLFEKEVPEIQQGTVEIDSIARIPGVRSKVAVHTNDDKVDPIGACVGYRRTRIQNIMEELGGEKIDVVQWSKDPKLFVSRAISPAKIEEIISEGENVFTVVVKDEELPKAIGRKGQNVWLASLLTNSKIEVMKSSDYKDRLFAKAISSVLTKDLDFLDEDLRKHLIDSGCSMVVTLFEYPTTEVAKTLGWDVEKVERIKKEIREHFKKNEKEN